MATICLSPTPLTSYVHKTARPRVVPECISVLSDSDCSECGQQEPFILDNVPPAASPKSNAMVLAHPATKRFVARSHPRGRRAGIPRPPRSKVVQPHRNALVVSGGTAKTIAKRPADSFRNVCKDDAPQVVPVDETRRAVEAEVRKAHRDQYMTRTEVFEMIWSLLQSRGLVDSVIDMLMKTSYRLFEVNAVYYGTFTQQTVCVWKGGDWVPYEVTHYNVFDGFLGYRINEDRSVEHVVINNHVRWKWPE